MPNRHDPAEPGIVSYINPFLAQGRFSNAGAGLGRFGTNFGGSGQGLPSSCAGGSALPPAGATIGHIPQGLPRLDESIQDDICRRLHEHCDIDACDIVVEVKDGDVTLRGVVGDRRSKRLAEEVAAGVPGVHTVHNRLEVKVFHEWIVRDPGANSSGTSQPR